MSGKTTVLIADDHPVVIEGIKHLLDQETDFEVVGSAQEGREALSMIQSQNPDIAVLDILMPLVDGVEVVRKINERPGKTRILIYSMSATKENIVSLFRNGISGYVLKEEPFSELMLALRTIRQGASFYSKTVLDILQDHMNELELEKGKHVADVKDGIDRLSVREKEGFVLLADGLTPREIANRLCISPKTAESHKYNIMEKLDLKSVAEFTKIAVKKKLIEI